MDVVIALLLLVIAVCCVALVILIWGITKALKYVVGIIFGFFKRRT